MNDDLQQRIEDLAVEIKQETGYGWFTAWNLAVKVLVASGDLQLQDQG